MCDAIADKLHEKINKRNKVYLFKFLKMECNLSYYIKIG
jgi:hypothetical protein